MEHDNSSSIILSVCIPTLGGGDRLETGLKRILSYKGNDIEVVISDNDNTGKIKTILNKFSDDRLHYHANEQNYGPFYNWIKVLTYGSGKYLLTLNDNDWILNENMEEIITFLKQEEASVVVSFPKHNGKIKYTVGARNGYSCTGEETHPSCFMIKREKLSLIEDIFSIVDKVQSYMQCTLALICCRDDKVCVNRQIGIIEMPDEIYYVSHTARGTKEIPRARGGFYYTPAGALEMLKSYIEICKEYYPTMQLKQMIPYLYKAQLKRATVEYKASSLSKVMKIRYGLPYREDININEERKLFYKNAKDLLVRENYKGKILVKVYLFTLWDKWSTNIKFVFDLLDEILHYCLERYSWAKHIQEIWRKLKYREKM